MLDEVGRIVDFSVIKEVVGGWLDRNWDHGFIAQADDPLVPWLDETEQKVFVVPSPPTAENLATYVLRLCCEPSSAVRIMLAEKGVTVTKVVCYETPMSRAEAIAV